MFSDDQRKRYARQIALAEIGQQGQSALLDASVLVIGAGGLGCPVLQILTTAGVGRIGLVDHDRVDLSNLHRQSLYSEQDVGKSKAVAAARRLTSLNSSIKIEPHSCKLDSNNITQLFSQYDLIVDGCDNFETRFLVNRECVEQKKPLFSGAVSEWEGQVSVFLGYEDLQPCYQCFCPQVPPASGRLDCSVAGVTGGLTSVVGSLLAMQLVHYVASSGEVLKGKMLRCNMLSGQFKTVKLVQDAACSICTPAV